MTPEWHGQLRHILTAIGTAMVALGWGTPELVESIVGHVVAVAVPLVGLIVFAVPIWLSWRAKQSRSAEAQKIAQRVVDDPGVPNPEVRPTRR